MSSVEFAPAHNPLEEEQGLSPEENAEVLELRERQQSAKLHSDALERRSFQSYRRTIGREINEMLEEDRARRAVKKATKARIQHYRDNKGGYKVQAVQDAAAEGVRTNFGT